MLSGIGELETLAKHGIKTIVPLSEVGQNLVDHSLTTVRWLVNSTQTVDDIARNVTLATDALIEWTTSGQGPLTFNGANQILYSRLPNNSPVLSHGDPSAGPTSAHFELLLAVCIRVLCRKLKMLNLL